MLTLLPDAVCVHIWYWIKMYYGFASVYIPKLLGKTSKTAFFITIYAADCNEMENSVISKQKIGMNKLEKMREYFID